MGRDIPALGLTIPQINLRRFWYMLAVGGFVDEADKAAREAVCRTAGTLTLFAADVAADQVT